MLLNGGVQIGTYVMKELSGSVGPRGRSQGSSSRSHVVKIGCTSLLEVGLTFLSTRLGDLLTIVTSGLAVHLRDGQTSRRDAGRYSFKCFDAVSDLRKEKPAVPGPSILRCSGSSVPTSMFPGSF